MNEDLKLGSIIWPNFTSPFSISCYCMNEGCTVLSVGSYEGSIVLFKVGENASSARGGGSCGSTSYPGSNETGVIGVDSVGAVFVSPGGGYKQELKKGAGGGDKFSLAGKHPDENETPMSSNSPGAGEPGDRVHKGSGAKLHRGEGRGKTEPLSGDETSAYMYSGGGWNVKPGEEPTGGEANPGKTDRGEADVEPPENRVNFLPYCILLNNNNNTCSNSIVQLCFGLSCSSLIECISKEILISLHLDNCLYFWSLDEGRCFRVVKGFSFFIYNLRVLPDRRFIVLCGDRKVLLMDLWGNKSREIIAQLTLDNYMKGRNNRSEKLQGERVGRGDAGIPGIAPNSNHCGNKGSSGTSRNYFIGDSADRHHSSSSSSEEMNDRVLIDGGDTGELQVGAPGSWSEMTDKSDTPYGSFLLYGSDAPRGGGKEEGKEEEGSISLKKNYVNRRNANLGVGTLRQNVRGQGNSYVASEERKPLEENLRNKDKTEGGNHTEKVRICCVATGLVPYLKEDNQRSLIQCFKLLKRKLYSTYRKKENIKRVVLHDNEAEVSGNNLSTDQNEEYTKTKQEEVNKKLNNLFSCPVFIVASLSNGDIICWDLTDFLIYYKGKCRFVIRIEKTELDLYKEIVNEITENCIMDEVLKINVHTSHDMNLKSHDRCLKCQDVYQQCNGLYIIEPTFISNLTPAEDWLEIATSGNSSRIGVIDSYVIILQETRLIIYEQKDSSSMFVPLMDLFCPDYHQKSQKRKRRNPHWVGLQVVRRPLLRFSSGIFKSSGLKTKSFDIMQKMSKNVCGSIIAWTTEGNFYSYTLPLKFSSLFLSFQSNIKSFFLMSVPKKYLGSHKSPIPIVIYKERICRKRNFLTDDDDDGEENRASNHNEGGSNYNNSNKFRIKINDSTEINRSYLKRNISMDSIKSNTASNDQVMFTRHTSYEYRNWPRSNTIGRGTRGKNINSMKYAKCKDDLLFLFISRKSPHRIVLFEGLLSAWFKTSRLEKVWLLPKRKRVMQTMKNKENKNDTILGGKGDEPVKVNPEVREEDNWDATAWLHMEHVLPPNIRRCSDLLTDLLHNKECTVEGGHAERAEVDRGGKSIVAYAIAERNQNIYVFLSFTNGRVLSALINSYGKSPRGKIIRKREGKTNGPGSRLIRELPLPHYVVKKSVFITTLHCERNYLVGGSSRGDILIWDIRSFKLKKFIKACHFNYVRSIHSVIDQNATNRGGGTCSVSKETESFWVLSCDASNNLILLNLNECNYDENNFSYLFCKNDRCRIAITTDEELLRKKELEILQKKKKKILFLNYMRNFFKKKGLYNNGKATERKDSLLHMLKIKKDLKVKLMEGFYYATSCTMSRPVCDSKGTLFNVKRKIHKKRKRHHGEIKNMINVCLYCSFKKLEKKNEINFKLINHVYVNTFSSLLYITSLNNLVFIYEYGSGCFLRCLYDSDFAAMCVVPTETCHMKLGVDVTSVRVLNRVRTGGSRVDGKVNTVVRGEVRAEVGSCNSSHRSSDGSSGLSDDRRRVRTESGGVPQGSILLAERENEHREEVYHCIPPRKSTPRTKVHGRAEVHRRAEAHGRANEKHPSSYIVKSQIPVISYVLFRDSNLSQKALPLTKFLFPFFLPPKCVHLCRELFPFLVSFPSIPFSLCIHGKESTLSTLIPMSTQIYYFSKMHSLKEGTCEGKVYVTISGGRRDKYHMQQKKKKEKFLFDSLHLDEPYIYNNRFKKKFFLSEEYKKKYLIFGIKMGSLKRRCNNFMEFSKYRNLQMYRYDEGSSLFNVDPRGTLGADPSGAEELQGETKKTELPRDKAEMMLKSRRDPTQSHGNRKSGSNSAACLNCNSARGGDSPERSSFKEEPYGVHNQPVKGEGGVAKRLIRNASSGTSCCPLNSVEDPKIFSTAARRKKYHMMQYNYYKDLRVRRRTMAGSTKWFLKYSDDEFANYSSDKSSLYLYVKSDRHRRSTGLHHRGSHTNRGSHTRHVQTQGRSPPVHRKLLFQNNSVDVYCNSVYVKTLYCCFMLRFLSLWCASSKGGQYDPATLFTFRKYIIENLPDSNTLNLFLLSYISMYPYDKSIRIQLQRFMCTVIANVKEKTLDKYAKTCTEILRINNKKKRIIQKNMDEISLYDTTGTYVITIMIPKVGSFFFYPFIYADEICLTLLLLLLLTKSHYLRNSKTFYTNANMITLIVHHICYYIFVDTQYLIEKENKFNKFKLFHFIHMLSLSFSITWDFHVLVQRGIFTSNMKNMSYLSFNLHLKKEDFNMNERMIDENYFKALRDYYILGAPPPGVAAAEAAVAPGVSTASVASTAPFAGAAMPLAGSDRTVGPSVNEINLNNYLDDFLAGPDNGKVGGEIESEREEQLPLQSYENVFSEVPSEGKSAILGKSNEVLDIGTNGSGPSPIVVGVINQVTSADQIHPVETIRRGQSYYNELYHLSCDESRMKMLQMNRKKSQINEHNYINICHFILNIFDLYTLSMNNMSFLKLLINTGRTEPYLFLKTLHYITSNVHRRVSCMNKILFLLIILIKNYKPIFVLYMDIIIDIVLNSLDPSNNVRILCLKLSTSLIYTLVKQYRICCFNKYTQRLAVANNMTKCIYLYDLKNAKKLKIFQGHKRDVDCINFNSTGTCLASYSKLDLSFKIWNCTNAGLFSGFLKIQSKCARDIQLSRIKLSYLYLSDDYIDISYKKKNEWALRREDNAVYLIYI
ncbi:hypothetical protein C922_02234 [Plasmodium inui San Antonio 1]|uniref:WD repeat-containing protein n=1 Tax=Plasmodium inui San Antonio 1 TaxID=1237626 RepID=W7A8E0_9APIC|nr:hypothetical protein C922_02234 [Plasmodium inui San Antonio 1]EUD67528.1 hypothetical protein C922_02234 [Plasmodium inui San Antonio 1]